MSVHRKPSRMIDDPRLQHVPDLYNGMCQAIKLLVAGQPLRKDEFMSWQAALTELTLKIVSAARAGEDTDALLSQISAYFTEINGACVSMTMLRNIGICEPS